ncbi:MAG: SDR family NAD(P)-dependent oxidoreductase, partial [Bacteroidota bacterium]
MPARPMTIDLTDKVVLVTGASRGIGAAVAARCGEAGATVAVHYGASKTEAEALAKSLPRAAAFQANLAHPEAPNELFEAVLQRYGRVDVLVNNAGVSPAAPLDASDETWLDVWTQTIDVNLRAAALLARAAVRHWLDRDEGGRLVTVASRASFRGDTADFIPYAASKAGLIGLTRSIARAFGKQGIVAFDVAPGFTRTD